MLRSWFGREEAPQTRFDSAREFRQIKSLLKKIRDKEQSLASAADANGFGSLDQQKHHIVKSFLDAADQVINPFNTQAAPNNANEDRRQKRELVRRLDRILDDTYRSHYFLLNRKRSAIKESAATGTRIGVFGGSIAAGVLSPPLFFGSGVLTFLGANATGHSLIASTGLYENRSHSIILFDTLKKLLGKVNDSLGLQIDGRASNHRAASSDGPHYHNEEPSALLSIYNEITQSYIETMREKPVSFAEELEALNLSEEARADFEPLEDTIIRDIPNIPVLLNGTMYDLDTLLDTPTRNGHHVDPYKNVEFFMRDIQPAFATAEAIQHLLNDKRRLAAENNNAHEEGATNDLAAPSNEETEQEASQYSYMR